MAKSQKQKLAVDGTAKLAAKAKASDKHEKANLTIEEATVASPRETRKRSGYFNDFEDDDGDNAATRPSGEAAEAPATNIKKKPNVKSTDHAVGEAKNAESKSDNAHAKNQQDVGDKARSEVEKPAKARKAKGSKKDKSLEASENTSELNSIKASKKPSKKGKAEEEAPETKKDEPTAKKAAAELAEAPEKEKPAKKKKVTDSSGDVVKADKAAIASKESEPRKAKATPKSGSEKAARPKKAAQENASGAGTKSDATSTKDVITTETDARSNPRKPKIPAQADATGESSKSKSNLVSEPTTALIGDSVSKPRKGKKDGRKIDSSADSAKDPDLAMDQGPFEALLDTGKENPAKEEVAAADENTAKPKKSRKSNDEKVEKKTAPVKPKDTLRKVPAPAESSTTEPAKSKKRKASATADAEVVKSDILDPLAEHASAAKRQKKGSRKSYGESFGELVNTGLEAAAQGANSLKQSLGGLTNDASKKLTDTAPEAVFSPGNTKESVTAAAKRARGKGKAVADAVTSAVAPPADEDGEGDSSESEANDYTSALLKGFESSGDDEPAKEGEGFKEGQPIPSLPDSRATEKQLNIIQPNSETSSGVVYLGRIPHGFYEHQMRAYFTQFGDIKRLRLSRSLKTGASKHYAFIEFESEEVAKIVAGTMDNYLMFGHILKCKLLPKENIHEDLWKGANKRFKAVPRNKIEGRQLAMAVGKEQWRARIEKEQRKREKKLEKTKELGYEFVSPELRSVDEVRKGIEEPVVEEEKVEQEKSLVVTAAKEGKEGGGVVVSEEVKTKKGKKGEKGKVEEVVKAVAKKTKRTLEEGAAVSKGAAKKAKKSGKKAAV